MGGRELSVCCMVVSLPVSLSVSSSLPSVLAFTSSRILSELSSLRWLRWLDCILAWFWFEFFWDLSLLVTLCFGDGGAERVQAF